MQIELWEIGKDVPLRKAEIHITNQPQVVRLNGDVYVLKKFPEYYLTQIHQLENCGACGKPTDNSFCDPCRENEKRMVDNG